jgi:putative membrane protein
MSRAFKTSALVAIILISASCPTVHAKTLTPHEIEQEKDLTVQEQQFIRSAAQSNLAEIKIGQLALEKAKDVNVKSMAKQMVLDHTKANSDLAMIAKKLGQSLPKDLDHQHNASFMALSSTLTGAFDALYVEQMVQSHQNAIRLMTTEFQKGSTSELKAYAAAYLPKIKMHYGEFERLQAKLTNNSAQSR